MVPMDSVFLETKKSHSSSQSSRVLNEVNEVTEGKLSHTTLALSSLTEKQVNRQALQTKTTLVRITGAFCFYQNGFLGNERPRRR